MSKLSTRRAQQPKPVEVETQTRGERKSRQILDGARALFLEQGFDTTSMDAVARHAGVSKATLYVHFENKDALLAALIDDECRRFGPQVLWEAAGGPIDVEKGLRAIAQSYLSFFLDRTGLAMHRLIMSCASRFPEIAETFMRAGPYRCEADVASFLRAAQAQGLLRIPDVKLAAIQLISLIQGRLPLTWALATQTPSESECRALVEGAIGVFLAAYGVVPRDGRYGGPPRRRAPPR